MKKRGVSEIVSYVLLIIIAIAIATLVFSYLRVFVYKGEIPKCEEDINLAIRKVTCVHQTSLEITLSNRGLFTIDSAYIKLRKAESGVKTEFEENNYPLGSSGEGLLPGEEVIISFAGEEYSDELETITAGAYELQIEPAVKDDSGEAILCNGAVITQPVACS